MTDPTSDDQVWVPVYLGDCRVGDTVRPMDGMIDPHSRYVDATGTIVGVRFGSITVRIGDDSVVFWPDQLERLSRPE